MHNEGFGKKWIDKILGKVDKDQGVANAGKVLGIGNDGQVVPVEQSGGGSGGSTEHTSFTTSLYNLLTAGIKPGDVLVINGAATSGFIKGPSAVESIDTNLSKITSWSSSTQSISIQSFVFTVQSITKSNNGISLYGSGQAVATLPKTATIGDANVLYTNNFVYNVTRLFATSSDGRIDFAKLIIAEGNYDSSTGVQYLGNSFTVANGQEVIGNDVSITVHRLS